MTDCTEHNIVIAADVHGNLKILECFATLLRDANPEDVYLLGDIVRSGRSADDNFCVDLVVQNGYQAVAGNHEAFALMRDLTSSATAPEDADPKSWDLDQQFYRSSMDYIKQLPMTLTRDELLFAHSIPDDSLRITSVTDAEHAFEYLARFPATRVCFVGHAHCPVCFVETNGKCIAIEADSIPVNSDSRYIINPGALQDGHYIEYDLKNRRIERRSLAF